MCITVGELVEEEEEKICGQHFAFSGGQLQQARRGSRGSLSPCSSPMPPTSLPGSSLKTCCHNPRGKDHQKRLCGFYIKGMWGRTVEWDELQSAGTVMGGRHEMVGLAMGLCLAPHNTISPQSWWKRAGTGWVSHLRPHKQRQGPCARELGVTRLKPPVHTKGYNTQRWAGSLSSTLFSIQTDSSSHFHLIWCPWALR